MKNPSDPKGGLPDPEYRGPGKPVRQQLPQDMPHVREGRHCGMCSEFDHSKGAQEHLRKIGFWDKVFHNRDDGHDLKPWMIGSPADYGICSAKDAAAHVFGKPCKKWKSKDTHLRFHIGSKK